LRLASWTAGSGLGPSGAVLLVRCSPPSYGIGGAFFFGVHVPERLAVFIDYQNVHLTAHNLFAPYGARPEHTLVHPLWLRSA